MRTETITNPIDGAAWARIIDAESGDLTAAAAQALLDFDFRPADRQRMDALAEKARAGTLTVAERNEAESFNRVAHVLALLQSKARQSLRRSATRR